MTNDQPTHDERGDASDELDPRWMAEADALEAILAGRSVRAEGPDGVSTVGSAEALAGLVGRVRSAYHLGSESGEDVDASTADAFQAKRVAQRVLEQTTREDLRRRGDLGVLLRFAGDRLRDSAFLRVAAALLIVQLTLVPLVAWQMLKTPHPGIFQTGIEPSTEELAKALEDLPRDELTSDLDGKVAALGSVVDRMALEEGAAEATGVLAAIHGGLAQEVAPTTSAGRALAAMTLLAARERCTAADTELVASLGTPDGPMESIVVAEARLYLLVCGGGWEGLLEALDHMTVSSAPSALSARTVRRAATLGVAISDRGESLIEAAGESWQRGGADWLVELGTALGAEAPGDPYVAAWLAAIVQDS